MMSWLCRWVFVLITIIILPLNFKTVKAEVTVKHKTVSSDLTILYPNGNEQLAGGTAVQVKWFCENLTFLKLEISLDSKNTWQVLKDSIKAGSFQSNVVIPDVMSTHAFMRLTSIVDGHGVGDTTDSDFIIISSEQKLIVVLGSSTASGAGATVVDSAWVWMYRKYLRSIDPKSYVINLAVAGSTTYQIMPTDFVPPNGRPNPNPNNNISKALSLNPDAIIVNLPTNDTNNHITLEEQLNNFDSLIVMTERRNVQIWVTTPQPRNFSEEQRKILVQVKDSLIARYSGRMIDFWTQIANQDGTINPIYDFGDGIHVNNAGHKVFLSRVKRKQILGYSTGISDNSNQKSSGDFLSVQNFPNPFNPLTKITVKASEPSYLKVEIFDESGRKITDLYNGAMLEQTENLEWNSQHMSNGIYFIKATSTNKNGVQVKISKATLLK